VALALPGAASAATVFVDPDRVIRFRAPVGEMNWVTVSAPDYPNVVIRDAGIPIVPGAGCSALNPNEVVCALRARPRWKGIRLELNDGGDTLSALCCGVVVSGGEGNDVLIGSAGIDSLNGGPGRDTIEGGAGQVRRGRTLLGDVLVGGPDGDILRGGPGPDRLLGGGGADRLDGGGASDVLLGEGDRDVMDGGMSADLLVGGTGPDLMKGGAGTDVLRAIDRARDNVRGGSGRDSATVDARLDRVRDVEELRTARR
jgi:RTX calcium-binding nonapeptide repeat (4 copies)